MKTESEIIYDIIKLTVGLNNCRNTIKFAKKSSKISDKHAKELEEAMVELRSTRRTLIELFAGAHSTQCDIVREELDKMEQLIKESEEE